MPRKKSKKKKSKKKQQKTETACCSLATPRGNYNILPEWEK